MVKVKKNQVIVHPLPWSIQWQIAFSVEMENQETTFNGWLRVRHYGIIDKIIDCCFVDARASA
jgi:hypothetical protein